MRRVIFATAGLSAAALAAIGLVVRRRWAMPDETLPVEPARVPPVPSAVISPQGPETTDLGLLEPDPVATDLASLDAVLSSEPSIEADFGPASPPPTKRAAKPRVRAGRSTAVKPAATPTEPATGD